MKKLFKEFSGQNYMLYMVSGFFLSIILSGLAMIYATQMGFINMLILELGCAFVMINIISVQPPKRVLFSFILNLVFILLSLTI